MALEDDALEVALAHRERLLAYARRILGDAHEAEDVAQEVALRAQRADAAGRPLAWLKAVCYRLAVDRLRARRRRARLERRFAARLVAAREAHAAIGADVAALVDSLDEPYRSAVRLRYLEELEFPELARRLGARERTARTWVARGVARLRERLGGDAAVWLEPLIIVLLAVLAALVLADREPALAPFIYSIF